MNPFQLSHLNCSFAPEKGFPGALASENIDNEVNKDKYVNHYQVKH